MDALSLSQIAAFGAAGAIAFAVWVLGDILTPNLLRGRQTSRLSMFASKGGAAETKTAVPVGSFAHRVQVAFSGVRMDASGREESLLFLARIAAGGAFAVGLFIIGLPPLTCLAGLPAGWIFVDSWITRSWSKVKTDVEGELPSMLTRLASIVQTSPNVPSAMETVAMTLRADGPLRQWCLDTAARMHRDGFAAIETIRENAVGISPSLAIATELVGRMWRTGGEGYSDAFSSAADNLEAVLDARVLARAKGTGAQGTVNIMTVMTFAIIGFMLHSDAMAESVNLPIVQITYAGIVLLIVYGYGQVSSLIDNSV